MANELPVVIEVAQLEGQQRVLEAGGHELGRRRMLVGEQHAGVGVDAAGSGRRLDLGQQSPPAGVVQIVDDAVGHDQIPLPRDHIVIEVADFGGQRNRVRLAQPGQLLDAGRADVDRGHVAAPAGQIEGVAALAAAEVEDPGPGRQQREDLHDVVVRATHGRHRGVAITLLPKGVNRHAGT